MAWFDIVIFAGVAAFLGWRLYSVLGERQEGDRMRGNPFDPARQPPPSSQLPPSPSSPPPSGTLPPSSDGPDALRQPGEGPTTETFRPLPSAAPDSLAGRLEAIAQADPSFTEKGFLSGVKAAFSLIVEAFAAEDTATLRPLLSDDVYDSFAAAIRSRQAAGEKLETKIVCVKDVTLEDASLQLNTARITVRIVTDQTETIRDRAGNVVSGDGGKPREVVDLWTFSRNTRALDPNWQLAETRFGE